MLYYHHLYKAQKHNQSYQFYTITILPSSIHLEAYYKVIKRMEIVTINVVVCSSITYITK